MTLPVGEKVKEVVYFLWLSLGQTACHGVRRETPKMMLAYKGGRIMSDTSVCSHVAAKANAVCHCNMVTVEAGLMCLVVKLPSKDFIDHEEVALECEPGGDVVKDNNVLVPRMSVSVTTFKRPHSRRTQV